MGQPQGGGQTTDSRADNGDMSRCFGDISTPEVIDKKTGYVQFSLHMLCQQ